MQFNRRGLLQAAGGVAVGTMFATDRVAAAPTAKPGDFSIDVAFARFMGESGGSPGDGGAAVTFTGRDPIVRSRFRTGARARASPRARSHSPRRFPTRRSALACPSAGARPRAAGSMCMAC